MIKRRPYHCLAALLCAFCFFVGLSATPPPASAFSLGGAIGDILKIGGIALVVRQFGGQIDRFINQAMQQRGIEREGMTKVVPVLRVGGGGTAVGAVQVVGPREQVRRVEAVGELELSIGRIRGRALLPVTTRRDLTDSIRGVGGVGVSANIKFPL